MKIGLNKNLLGATLLLTIGAAPALPSVVLNFNFQSGVSGSDSYTGSANTVSGTLYLDEFSENKNGVMTYFPGPTSGTTLSDMIEVIFNNGTSSLSMNGVETGGNFGVLGSLFSATTKLNNTGGSSLTETVSGLTSSVNATFLSELGLVTGTKFIISGTITGSGGSITGETLTLTQTPEPASVYSFAGELLVVLAYFLWNRRRPVNHDPI